MSDTAKIIEKYKSTPGYELLKDPSRVLFVSSAHIGAITRKKLETAVHGGNGLTLTRVYGHADGGYLIDFGPDYPKLAAVSRCVYDIARIAVSEYKSVICIDPDADPIPGLTLYGN